MKNRIFEIFLKVLFFTIATSPCFSQVFKVEADNNELLVFDQVHFGFLESASIGIDELDEYNEENLFGILAEDEAELRMYQRDQEHFNCLFNEGEEVYFPVRFDSKDNIRNSNCPSNDCLFEVVVEKGYFEMINFAVEDVFALEYAIPDYIERIDIYSSCNKLIEAFEFEKYQGENLAQIRFPGVYPSTLDTVKSIVVEFKSNILTSSSEINTTGHTFNVYPNPSSSLIYINNTQNQIVELELFDIDGRFIKERKITQQDKIELDTSDLKPSMYLLKLRTKDGSIYFEKVIKI